MKHRSYLVGVGCALQHLINTIKNEVPMGEVEEIKRLVIKEIEKFDMEVKVMNPKVITFVIKKEVEE